MAAALPQQTPRSSRPHGPADPCPRRAGRPGATAAGPALHPCGPPDRATAQGARWFRPATPGPAGGGGVDDPAAHGPSRPAGDVGRHVGELQPAVVVGLDPGPSASPGCSERRDRRQWCVAAETTGTAGVGPDRPGCGRPQQLAALARLDRPQPGTVARAELASLALECAWQRCAADVGRPGTGPDHQQRRRWPRLVDPMGGGAGGWLALAAAAAHRSALGLAATPQQRRALGTGAAPRQCRPGAAAPHPVALVQPPALAASGPALRRRAGSTARLRGAPLGGPVLAGSRPWTEPGWIGHAGDPRATTAEPQPAAGGVRAVGWRPSHQTSPAPAAATRAGDPGDRLGPGAAGPLAQPPLAVGAE